MVLVENGRFLARTILGATFRELSGEDHTVGDGFFATFDGPARAIRCAHAIADPVAELALQVRAGSTPEVEVTGTQLAG